MAYKYILCDADDTLLDFPAAETAAFRESLCEFGVKFTDEIYGRYHIINDNYWKMLERGETTREKLKIARFATLFAETGILPEDTAEAFANAYIKNLSHHCIFLPGALATLATISEKYDVYIITNGLSTTQHGRLDNSPMMEYVKGVYISEDIGFAKPSREYFDYVINHIGDSDLSNYIVVGDSPTSDIKGAVDYGLDSVFVRGNKEYRDYSQTYTINSFTEITDIL